VVDGVVEATDVRVEHPAHPPPHDPGRQRIQRPMRAAPRPKPMGEAEKVRLVDGVQDLDNGTLEKLVPQRGNAQRSLPPLRLRDLHPPRRSRPVGAPMDAGTQIAKILPETRPAILPRHPVHPGRGLRVQPPVGRRKRSTSTRCRSAVNHTFLSCSATRRTRSSALGTLKPAPCPGRLALAAFSFAQAASLPAAAACAALFGGLAATSGLSDFSSPCLSGVRHSLPRAARPAVTKTGGHETSRFSRPETPDAQRLFDRTGSTGSSRVSLPAVLPSARTHGVRTPNWINLAAPSPRPRVPLPTLRRRPRGQPTHGPGPPRLARPSM
jgi:hypothetical protein